MCSPVEISAGLFPFVAYKSLPARGYANPMKLFRPIIAFVFAFALLLTGGVTAYAKALSAGGQNMLICSEVGTRTAIIGANGQELPPIHVCDECCIAIAMQALPMPDMRPKALAQRAVFVALAPLPAQAPVLPAQLARAPPL